MKLAVKRIVGAMAAAIMVLALIPASPVHAEEHLSDWAQDSGRHETMPLQAHVDQAGLSSLPEWAQDPNFQETVSLLTQGDLPARFDLRERGVVTPVKTQNPWATCWAFASIAAAEISIISDLGAPADLDLSEKHLVWYGMHPVKENDVGGQAGEGITVFDESKDGASAAYTPSNRIVVSTLFSTGVGSVYENDTDGMPGFPYHGKAGITELDALTNGKYRQAVRESRKKELIKYYGSEENLLLIVRKLTKYKTIDEYVEAEIENEIKNFSTNTYSSIDDWSIPDTDESGESNRNVFAGYTLRHGNQLPPIKAYDNKLSQEGMQAVKRELMDDHGVIIGFHADTSLPNQKNKSDYINLVNWAHYTYREIGSNHSVCIVGWDDNYPAANFTHGIKDVGNEEAAKLTTPPGNGAWIAKNSWGCSAGCGTAVNDKSQVLGKSNWGVDGSGFFYISYYDQSLANPESLEFDDDFAGDEFISHVYDYLPSTSGFYELYSKEVMSSANIFTAAEDEQVVSVSTRSTEPNSRVTFALYKLKDDAKDPTDGELVETQSYDIDYKGFHRFDLTVPFKIHKGQKFSIVSTVYRMNGGAREYDVSASASTGKQIAELRGYPFYGTAVVHKGESALYKNGKWIDWLDYQQHDRDFLDDASGDAVDNFSIKAYALPWNEVVYACVQGDGATWTQGSSDGLTFIFEETVKKGRPNFDHATVDGVDIDQTASVMDSSNMVTSLSPEYLSTLEVGKHVLTVYFEDGDPVKATFAIVAPDQSSDSKPAPASSTSAPSAGPTAKATTLPRAGDTTSIVPIALLLASSVVLILLRRRLRKDAR